MRATGDIASYFIDMRLHGFSVHPWRCDSRPWSARRANLFRRRQRSYVSTVTLVEGWRFGIDHRQGYLHWYSAPIRRESWIYSGEKAARDNSQE